jgi:phosphate transport system substrate-binding protein
VKRSTVRAAALPAIATFSLVLAACGGGNEEAATASPASGSAAGSSAAALSGEIIVDGSSTVAPLTTAAAELYSEVQPGVKVSVATSGTGGGFKKFCQGQTDISNASRKIKDAEKAECAKSGVEFVELQVAMDALTVVASKDNTFATCLTTGELKKIWEPAAEGKVTTWKQVKDSFPADKLELYGPGTDSGTFDYFTDEINGEEGKSRTDYNASEDDNIIVQGVSGSKSALGYFGFSYYEENEGKLKAVQVDGGKGCVTPSVATAQDGSYAPLSRPLFIYVSKKAAAQKPQVKDFVGFYSKTDQKITEAAKFVPLNETQRTELASAAGGITG